MLHALVATSLNEAEMIWTQCGPEMRKKALAALSESFSAEAQAHPSRIPGHPIVMDGEPKVDQFVAVVVDLRDSSKHLTQAISAKITPVNQEERLLYETSALLPVAAKLLDTNGGQATEYVGDGVLGLFNVTELGTDDAIYSAHRAAKGCLEACETIINPELERRYNLPAISIGVGMGLSKAIIMPVGYDGFRQPRAIGECVFRATKLCGGRGEIWVDKAVRFSWPTKEGGKLRFRQFQKGEMEGFVVEKE
jgi:class 3 adenylate cyclase